MGHLDDERFLIPHEKPCQYWIYGHLRFIDVLNSGVKSIEQQMAGYENGASPEMAFQNNRDNHDESMGFTGYPVNPRHFQTNQV